MTRGFETQAAVVDHRTHEKVREKWIGRDDAGLRLGRCTQARTEF